MVQVFEPENVRAVDDAGREIYRKSEKLDRGERLIAVPLKDFTGTKLTVTVECDGVTDSLPLVKEDDPFA